MVITDEQAQIITWIYHLSGAISFVSCILFLFYIIHVITRGAKIEITKRITNYNNNEKEDSSSSSSSIIRKKKKRNEELNEKRNEFNFLSLYSFVILIFLSTTDTITGFVYMISWIPVEEELNLCELERFIIQITQTSSVFWVVTICVSLFLVYNYTKRVMINTTGLKMMIFMFILIFPLFCWGIPLLTAFYLFINGSFYNRGDWCWLQEHEVTRIIFLFTPILLGFVVSVVVLLMVTRKRNLSNYGAVIVDLLLYILAFAFVWFIPLINSIVIASTSRHILILEFLTAFMLPLQGFCNFLIWGVLMKFRKYKYSNLDALDDDYDLYDDFLENEMTPITSTKRKTKKILFFGRVITIHLPSPSSRDLSLKK